MTKAENLMKEVERRIEDVCTVFYDKSDFWELEGKRIYAALYELTSYTRDLEKQINKDL